MRAYTDMLRAAPPKVPPAVLPDGAGAFASASPGPLRILIVEDESVIAWALQSLLEDLGHEVVEVVASGEAALAAAAAHRPELILMDINLGRGLDGIEAAEQIRADGPVTVIFVSAYGDQSTMARIDERVPGAPLLTKPVSAKVVRQAIEAATGTRH
ncbi:MAG TPA: response regulator [Allosphingosinicella sp.]